MTINDKNTIINNEKLTLSSFIIKPMNIRLVHKWAKYTDGAYHRAPPQLYQANLSSQSYKAGDQIELNPANVNWSKTQWFHTLSSSLSLIQINNFEISVSSQPTKLQHLAHCHILS